MSDIAFLSATDLVNRLKRKEIGVLELCDHYIDRIDRLDHFTNAVVVRDFDRARAYAKKADNTPMDNRGLLYGLPMTIKESYDIEGLPTTWGIPVFASNRAKEDAIIVNRYKEAGAIFLGKTNVPIHLSDFQSYNEIYGTTNNPWDCGRTPGGSSGGAAAALAAGLTGLETGSDIGGSIRNPAHFCGVFGHKPTWGIVPSQGHALPGVLAAPDIAVCGPMARDARDLALAMRVIAGTEPLNRNGWKLTLPRCDKQRLEDFRVVVWSDDDLCPVSEEIASRASAVGAFLEGLGATVSYSARPAMDIVRSHHTYLGLLHSIMGAGVSQEVFDKSKAYAATIDAEDMSDWAIMTRAMVMDHRTWLRLNNYREMMRYAWRDFFKDWDVLICPQMATTAFQHDHSNMSSRMIEVNGDEQSMFQQIFWSGLASASYLPSTVFPTGLSEEGLPIGLQAISGTYQDFTSIRFCELLTEARGGFQRPKRFL